MRNASVLAVVYHQVPNTWQEIQIRHIASYQISPFRNSKGGARNKTKRAGSAQVHQHTCSHRQKPATSQLLHRRWESKTRYYKLFGRVNLEDRAHRRMTSIRISSWLVIHQKLVSTPNPAFSSSSKSALGDRIQVLAHTILSYRGRPEIQTSVILSHHQNVKASSTSRVRILT